MNSVFVFSDGTVSEGVFPEKDALSELYIYMDWIQVLVDMSEIFKTCMVLSLPHHFKVSTCTFF